MALLVKMVAEGIPAGDVTVVLAKRAARGWLAMMVSPLGGGRRGIPAAAVHQRSVSEPSTSSWRRGSQPWVLVDVAPGEPCVRASGE